MHRSRRRSKNASAAQPSQPTTGPAESRTSASKICNCAQLMTPITPHDEEHAWHGVTMQNVQNAWVRRVEFRHFAGGAVALWENTKWITVEDCISLEPVSELGGYRRHTFFTQGQLTLFLRCWSEHGRHDFAVGHCAPGRTRSSIATRPTRTPTAARSKAGPPACSTTTCGSTAPGSTSRTAGSPAGRRLVGRQLRAVAMPGRDDARRPPADRQQLGDRRVGRLLRRRHVRTPAAISSSRSVCIRPSCANVAARRPPSTYRPGPGRSDRLDQPDARRSGRSSSNNRGKPAAAIDRRHSRSDSARAARKRRQTTARNSSTRVLSTDVTHIPDPQQTPRRSKTAGSSSTAASSPAALRATRLSGAATIRRTKRRIRPGHHALRARPRRHRVHRRPRRSRRRHARQGVAAFDHHYGLWYDRRRDDHTMVRQQDGDVAAAVLRAAVRPHRPAAHGLGRPQQIRPHEVQSVVLAAAARLRAAVRRARPGAAPPELLPAQHPGSRRPLGRLPLAAGEQRQRHGPARAAALHRRQADLHGAERSTT